MDTRRKSCRFNTPIRGPMTRTSRLAPPEHACSDYGRVGWGGGGGGGGGGLLFLLAISLPFSAKVAESQSLCQVFGNTNVCNRAITFAENVGNAVVAISNVSSSSLAVTYSTKNGTATQSQDYSSVSGNTTVGRLSSCPCENYLICCY